MPGVFDRLLRRKKKQQQPPEGLYSPPERGGEDPDPSAFNVGDTVVSMGTEQSGAPALATGDRRELDEPFVVPDKVNGTIKGVDLDQVFVAFPVVVPKEPWRHARRDQGPEYDVGDRLKATSPVSTDYGIIPKNHVVNVLDADVGDDMMRVQLMMQFNKQDWFNKQDPSLRRWGRRKRAPNHRRLFREVWYTNDDRTACAADRATEGHRAVVLKPGAKVINVSNDVLRRSASVEDDVDALRTEDRLIILNPAAIEAEGEQRRRWLTASANDDDPARGSVQWQGMPISVEFFSGEQRPPMGLTTPFPYGYFNGSHAMDGDGVDVMLGPKWRDPEVQVWIVEQMTPDDPSTLQQYKTFLGFDDEAAVTDAFLQLWPQAMMGECESTSPPLYRDVWFPELNEEPEVREEETSNEDASE